MKWVLLSALTIAAALTSSGCFSPEDHRPVEERCQNQRFYCQSQGGKTYDGPVCGAEKNSDYESWVKEIAEEGDSFSCTMQ